MLVDYLHFVYTIISQSPITVIDVAMFFLYIIFIKQEKNIGIIGSTINTVIVLLTFIVSLSLYPFASSLLTSNFSITKGIADGISLLFNGAVALILFTALSRFIHVEREESENFFRFLPFLTGTISFLVAASWLIVVLLSFPFSMSFRNLFLQSKFTKLTSPRVLDADIRIHQFILPDFNALNFLADTTAHNTIYTLHFKMHNLPEQVNSEQEIVQAINQLRMNNHQNSLSMDPTLSGYSKQQAQEIIASGVFSTKTEQGLTLYDRLSMGNYSYASASEVVILAPSTDYAFAGILAYPQLKSIFLQQRFNSIGIGVYNSGSYGVIIVIDLVQ